MGQHAATEEGFSLIELVVVVAVLAILAAIGIGSYFKVLNLARENKSLVDVNSYVRMIAFCQAAGTMTELPKNAGELSRCTPVPACQWAAHLKGPGACGAGGGLELGQDNPTTAQWNSPDGYYNIRMDTDQEKINIRAIPYFADFQGVTACYNPSGGSKLETFQIDNSNYDGGKRMRGINDTTNDVPLLDC